jgi:hypothetical protein
VTSLDRPDLSKNHSRLLFKVGYAVRYPRRILPYRRRWARDVRLGLRTRDHVSYYRAVMHANVARSPEFAVGGGTHEAWLRQGQTQFDYLLGHGLDPGMRVLEIGCGNLRAGRLLIDYLERSPDLLPVSRTSQRRCAGTRKASIAPRPLSSC